MPLLRFGSQEDGSARLSIETIRANVEDFTTRVYKMGKANKDDQVQHHHQLHVGACRSIWQVLETAMQP